jgi:hypothetical protein
LPIRRHASLLVALLVSFALQVPLTVDAHQSQGQLRGGLSSLALGRAAIDPSIESRAGDGGRQIAVSVDVGATPDPPTRSRLRAAGLVTRGAWRTTIEGFISPSRLLDLARVRGVSSITPIRRPLGSSFVGPAPALHGATPWQGLGFSGAGVKVGILDVGFEGFAGLLGSELPATVAARCYAQLGLATSTLADCASPGVKHGTAVAESIIDMAPGASLYISNARSLADLASTIRWMTGAGVRIINFSQGSIWDGMGDGTSRYSTSNYSLVDLAVAGGALFVASAGNEGLTTWLGAPVDADADGLVDFAPGENGDTFDLDAGDEVDVAIRWASAGADYDLSVWQGAAKIADSVDRQSLIGDPLEFLSFTAETAGTYRIAIKHRAGSVAPLLRLMVATEAATSLKYRTTAGSLSAPADSRSAGIVTVGAVDYRAPTTVEPYSSQGPTLDGRTKPDLVAVDCAPTTIIPVFCGTSESAPFVTGAAALIVESDPAATPAQLASYLRSRATPLGSPIPNNSSGFGLLSVGPLPVTVPASLAFLAPAASGAAGAPLLGQPVVGVLDASGQVVTNGPGATLAITLSVATNAGGGTLACPAGLTAVAVAGVARFGGCAIDAAASGYTLRADAPGLPGVVGAPFAVAASGSPPALILSLSATSITFGAAVDLRAQAALPAGANLAVEAEWGTAGLYREPGATTTDPSGLASWTARPYIDSDYRVRSTASGTGLVEVSAPVHVRVNATSAMASSLASGRTITRTKKLTFTTTIRPTGSLVARGRARIDVMQRTRAGWTRRRTLYANADPAGRARLTLTLSTVGSWWIRSRAEPTGTNGASAWTSGFRYTVKR